MQEIPVFMEGKYRTDEAIDDITRRMNRRDLPITEIQEGLLSLLGTSNRIVIQAPTGSGKSTQIPQYLAGREKRGTGQILVLQPRRLAARMLASRVAREMNVQLGRQVGYQIRFENFSTPETRIRFVTEGVLLRQMLSDPLLSNVETIIFDEFHERHLFGDITLARALEVQEKSRPDLNIIVMSATLDTGKLKEVLDPCSFLSAEGRTFSVEMDYLRAPISFEDIPVWEVAARELNRILPGHPEGDILVFMPGAYEIHQTVNALRDALGNQFQIFPLHGELPPLEQDAALEKSTHRKVIVATNIAETSLTIEGVQMVIDSGLARVARYDPYRGINTLLVEKISRASADQRAGRAGRTAPGFCLRLWTRNEQEERQPHELPEIRRLDLSEVILTLKASGVDDLNSFKWIEPPDHMRVRKAESLLKDLGALDFQSGAITSIGHQLLNFPVHPRYARMLLEASERNCFEPVALIAALMQFRNLFHRSAPAESRELSQILNESEQGSDFYVLMKAWRMAQGAGYNVQKCHSLGIHAQTARQVGELHQQFLRLARKASENDSAGNFSHADLQRCVLAGFPDHLAIRENFNSPRCNVVNGRKGLLSKKSLVQHSRLLVAVEIRETQGQSQEPTVFLELCTAIEESWLKELFPEHLRETRQVEFDSTQKRVVMNVRIWFRDLLMENAQSDAPPEADAAEVLAREVLSGRLTLEQWDDAVEQWITRVNCLREWMPELDLPSINEEDRAFLIQQICLGCSSARHVQSAPVWPVIKSWLSQQQQQWLDQFAPERLQLPNGRKAKITYALGQQPIIATKIQDLYGIEEGIWLAKRRIQVVIQILAPNFRPIQITQNLTGFWRDTYPKLRSELQRRYPKHEWR